MYRTEIVLQGVVPQKELLDLINGCDLGQLDMMGYKDQKQTFCVMSR